MAEVDDSQAQDISVQQDQQERREQRVEGPFSHIYEEFRDYFGNLIDAVNTRTNELTDRNEALEEQLDTLQRDFDVKFREYSAEKERICWILWRAANLRVNLSRRSIRMDEAFKQMQDDVDVLVQETMLSDAVRRLLATVLTRTHEQYDKLEAWNDGVLQDLASLESDHYILKKKYAALASAWQQKTGLPLPKRQTEIEEEQNGAAARMQEQKRHLQQQREQKLVSGEFAPLPVNVPVNWAKFDPKDFTQSLVESLGAQEQRGFSPIRKRRTQNADGVQIPPPKPSVTALRAIFPPPQPFEAANLNHNLRQRKVPANTQSDSAALAPAASVSNPSGRPPTGTGRAAKHNGGVQSGPSSNDAQDSESENLEPDLQGQVEGLGEVLFKQQAFKPEELREYRLRVLDLHTKVEQRAIEVGKNCGKDDEARRLDRRKRLDELGGKLQQEMNVNLGYLPLPDKPIPVPRWRVTRVREPAIAPADPVKTEFGEIDIDTILPPSAFETEAQGPIDSASEPREESPWVDDDPHDPRREEIFARILDKLERRAQLIEIGKRKALELDSEVEEAAFESSEDTSSTPQANPRKSKRGERDSYEDEESFMSSFTEEEEKNQARKRRKVGQQRRDDAPYKGKITKSGQLGRVRKVPAAAANTVAAAGGKTLSKPRPAELPKKKTQSTLRKGKGKPTEPQMEIRVPKAVAAVFSESSTSYKDDSEDEPESEEQESEESDPTWEERRSKTRHPTRRPATSKAPSTIKSRAKRR